MTHITQGEIQDQIVNALCMDFHGRLSEARAMIDIALPNAVASGCVSLIDMARYCMATVCVEEGRKEEAVELYWRLARSEEAQAEAEDYPRWKAVHTGYAEMFREMAREVEEEIAKLGEGITQM